MPKILANTIAYVLNQLHHSYIIMEAGSFVLKRNHLLMPVATFASETFQTPGLCVGKLLRVVVRGGLRA